MQTGTVYTETIVYSAPEQFVSEAPYQLAIVILDDDEGRRTVRIDGAGGRVAIGDRVIFTHDRDGISFFRKDG